MFYYKIPWFCYGFNPIQDGTGFSPGTSTNVGISPQNFLNFSLPILSHWCEVSSLYLVQVPIY